MRILMAVTGLRMGGAERLVADMADALPADVHIAYLKDPVQVRPRRQDVAMTCLGFDAPGQLVPASRRLLQVCRAFRPDIVHAHMFHAALMARLLRPLAPPTRLVSTMHSADDGGPLRAFAFRATERLSDLSTHVSHQAVERYVARGASRRDDMLAIHNGIDVDRFHALPGARARVRATYGVPDGCRLLLAVGRLEPAKDYPTLFQALARLDPAIDFRLLVAGDGPERDRLERLAEALGLAARVRFLGIRDDVPALMSAADVFVLSSMRESFGLVVAEAMACECVVVATDAGGVREVMGADPLLRPPRDPDALADAIARACALDPAQAAAHGRVARERIVARFSFERMIEDWMAVYRGLLA